MTRTSTRSSLVRLLRPQTACRTQPMTAPETWRTVPRERRRRLQAEVSVRPGQWHSIAPFVPFDHHLHHLLATVLLHLNFLSDFCFCSSFVVTCGYLHHFKERWPKKRPVHRLRSKVPRGSRRMLQNRNRRLKAVRRAPVKEALCQDEKMEHWTSLIIPGSDLTELRRRFYKQEALEGRISDQSNPV